MYRIIGADQKEYGPVSAEELKRWLSEGRVNARTFVKAEGGMEWKPLSAFPEFAIEAGPAPLSSPPPPFATGPGQMAVSGTNSMAIAGLIFAGLGMFCCGPLFSTLGLVFSCVGLGQIKQTGQGGRELAIVGIILSLLGYLVFMGFLMIGLHHHHVIHQFDI